MKEHENVCQEIGITPPCSELPVAVLAQFLRKTAIVFQAVECPQYDFYKSTLCMKMLSFWQTLMNFNLHMSAED